MAEAYRLFSPSRRLSDYQTANRNRRAGDSKLASAPIPMARSPKFFTLVDCERVQFAPSNFVLVLEARRSPDQRPAANSKQTVLLSSLFHHELDVGLAEFKCWQMRQRRREPFGLNAVCSSRLRSHQPTLPMLLRKQ
jgi:hypothetical protein